MPAVLRPLPCAQRPLNPAAILAGDPCAFESLVAQESGRLLRVILRFVRDEDEARSLVQETFLQAYQRLHTFRGEARLTTWLYAIGINLARASLRKTRRYDTVEGADLERLLPAGAADPEAHPQQHAERSERQRLLHDALQHLPDDYRTVIELRDLQELSTAEAAASLGMSEGAVRVRLHRARRALRDLLAPRLAA